MQPHDFQRRGYTIQIFVSEGIPTGLKLVEKSNWTGLGVVCPRPRFSAVKNGEAFRKPGVYVLMGPSGTADLPIAYIGEGDPVRVRLEDHHSKKDFWTVAYFFTSKDSHLNKAHVEHLEHRLVEIAHDAKRCTLDNANRPAAPSLSAPELAFVETFLDEMLLCFPVLGVTIFEKITSTSEPRRILYLTNKNVRAEGYESEDGFVVRKGATAVIETVPSIHTYTVSMRHELVKSGVLKQINPNFFQLTEDYEFASPSAAAAVLTGSSINGRDWWKTADGTSLKELQSKSAE